VVLKRLFVEHGLEAKAMYLLRFVLLRALGASDVCGLRSIRSASRWRLAVALLLAFGAPHTSHVIACSVCGCCRPEPDDPLSQYLYGEAPPIYDGSYEVGQQAPAPGGVGSAVIPIDPGSWSLVLMPDTQHYSQTYPEHFDAQTQWIKDQRTALNIKYVLHEGDIVNTAADTDQWDNARAALDTLNGFVPYALAPGNHDYGGQGQNRTTFFDHQATDSDTNNYFGVGTPYASQTSIGGFYPGDGPGKTDNSYHTFNSNGEDWIVFAMEWGPRDVVVQWADQVLTAHPNHNAILVTHAYMYNDDTIYDWATKGSSQSWNPHSYGIQTWVDPLTQASPSVNDGQELWDEFVKKHENFKFVFNGHVLGDGTGRRATLGDNGNVVHQILANYQMNAQGGQGDMRVLEFKADGETVVVRTYSPVLDRYNTAPDQQFTLNMNQIPEPPPPIGHAVAGNLVASGLTDPGTNTVDSVTVPQFSAPGVGVSSNINRGDFQPTFGGSAQTFSKGILLATISQHSRSDFTYPDLTHFRRATVEAGRTPFGDGNLSLSIMEAGAAPAATQNEVNFNTSVAWFDFASGFRGAHVNGGTGILPAGGFSGVAQSMVTKTNTGRYTVDLDVNSQTDGMLFTIGNTNNNLVVQTAPAANGTNWDVRTHLNSTNFGATGTDTVPTASGGDNAAHWSFLYLPYETPGLIGGYFDGFTGTNIQSVGNFSMSRTSTGQYQLTVAGESPTTGMLILTVAHQENQSGVFAPADNILTYDAGAGGTFSINSYDLPDLGVGPNYGAQDTKFVWAFISFDDPITPYFLPGDYNHDWLVDNADYATWRAQFGKTTGYITADGNGDGKVDAADYAVWRKHSTTGGAGAVEGGAVPEPATLGLGAIVGILFALPRRTGRNRNNRSSQAG
jgi:hypothetical protein